MLQSGRIVDAIAGHGHHFAVGLQCLNQLKFLGWGHTGKDIDGIHHLRQGVGAQGCQGRSIHGLNLSRGANSHQPSNGDGRLNVIAGDQFHLDPSGPAGGNRLDRLRSRRVLHSLEAKKGEIAVEVVVLKPLLLCTKTNGKRQDPLALARHGGDRRLYRLGIEHATLPLRVQRMTAALQNSLHGSLQQDALTAVQGRHVLPFGLERNHIAPRVLVMG